MSSADRQLPDAPDLADVFRAYPVGLRPLLEYHDALLRGESPLSVADRELIAAYVSGLNACGFCLGAHAIIAEALGVDAALIDSLIEDLDHAPVDDRLRPLLAYVGKLTRAPASVRAADRDAVFAAGWSERALHDAVATCALFSFMNRLVEGMGVATSPAIQAAQRQRSAAHAESETSPTPYLDYGRRIGAVDSD